MSPTPPIENRAGLPGPDFDRLSDVLAGLGTMRHVLDWFASHRPSLAPGGMVTQDEFSFDILVPFRDGLHLAFDTT